ncbi:MAG TPA: DUF362 domain-containing protein [Candidatus Omnitrophota bacterium]|nr:DUF362 domain-containing protein [Candidatus Omnitrophota bacterium]
MKSDVYLSPVNTNRPEDRLIALKKLLTTADPFKKFVKGECVPVKITIGDSGCVHHVSPELVGIVITEIKNCGAKPFLFDTSVIYKGERQNAVDHLSLAEKKGFGYSRIGAPFIIADGVFGNDGKEYDIGSQDISKIKVPSFVGMADSLVVITHATGHIVSKYAGAIKNIAMGMACRPTKQVQHSSLKPSVITRSCTGCGQCLKICPVQAITMSDKKAVIDQSICVGCGECLCACKFNAILLNWDEDPHVFSRRMVDVAKFVLSRFKNKFFITSALDITKECDCISSKDDIMVSTNIGFLGSYDILALEQATIDMITKNKQTDFFAKDRDIFIDMIDYADKHGLGSTVYKIVEA